MLSYETNIIHALSDGTCKRKKNENSENDTNE